LFFQLLQIGHFSSPLSCKILDFRMTTVAQPPAHQIP